MSGYCVKCKRKTANKGGVQICATKNNRKMVKSKCACGTTKCQFLPGGSSKGRKGKGLKGKGFADDFLAGWKGVFEPVTGFVNALNPLTGVANAIRR